MDTIIQNEEPMSGLSYKVGPSLTSEYTSLVRSNGFQKAIFIHLRFFHSMSRETIKFIIGMICELMYARCSFVSLHCRLFSTYEFDYLFGIFTSLLHHSTLSWFCGAYIFGLHWINKSTVFRSFKIIVCTTSWLNILYRQQ